MIGNDKILQNDPTSISFASSGEIFAIADNSGSISVWHKDLIFINKVTSHSQWAWSCCFVPRQRIILSGSSDGHLMENRVIFSVIHCIYQDRYAFGDQMTDVIVQHLTTETRVRIKCKDYVKKIALFRDRLALLLSDKVVIYSVSGEDPLDMKYKALKKIPLKAECSLLLITSQHIIICYEKYIDVLTFSAELEHQWMFDSVIRFCKVIGGPSGREGILVGLNNGETLKMFVDNPFPTTIIKQNSPIKYLDLSIERKKMALVDDFGNLFVYNLETKEVIYQDTKITSVAWNTDMEEMLAYSTENGSLIIRLGDLPPVEQKMIGIVIGFKSSKIYCLVGASMHVVDVPQSATLSKLIELKQYEKAFQVACLGVTEQDWKNLGQESLLDSQFAVAKRSYYKLKDLKMVELICKYERDSKLSNFSLNAMQAEIMAYNSNFKEAANIFSKGGEIEKAIMMFCTMKRWDEATTLLSKAEKNLRNSTDNSKASNLKQIYKEMLVGQAEWAEENGDLENAAKISILIGEKARAIDLYGRQGQLEPLYEICKQLDKKNEEELIKKCANYFIEKGHHGYAKDSLLRLGDITSLMKLHVKLAKWDEAFLLAKQNPSLNNLIYLPYAEWLVKQEKYDEAIEAFKKSKRTDLSHKIVYSLAKNAVLERRFQDAGRYYWELSWEILRSAKTQDDIFYYESCVSNANIYFAYDLVSKYMEEPFQDLIGNNIASLYVFNAAVYIINNMDKETPANVNKVYLYYAIGRIGCQIEAFKTARMAFDKLQYQKVPILWQNQIDIETLKLKSRPINDKEGITPKCNRCTKDNPIIGLNKDRCKFCGHPFIRSFVSFDILPLVEFCLPSGLSHQKAITYFSNLASKKPTTNKQKNDGWKEVVDSKQQTLSLGLENNESTDLFMQKALEVAELATDPDNYKPITAEVKMLEEMREDEVLIEDMTHIREEYPRKYYKNIIEELSLISCKNCGKMFLEEEYELSLVTTGHCPFCLFKEDNENKSN